MAVERTEKAQQLTAFSFSGSGREIQLMLRLLQLLLGAFLRLFRSRRQLIMENLVLRQQLTVLKARRKRPKLRAYDKLFGCWSGGFGRGGRARCSWSRPRRSSAGTR